jgi:nicotinamidase-related amidase
MTDMPYDRARTGLLLVGSSNDFLAPEGKLWPFAKEVAEAVNLLVHLRAIVASACQAGIQVLFVPHHRWEPGDNLVLPSVPRRHVAARADSACG